MQLLGKPVVTPAVHSYKNASLQQFTGLLKQYGFRPTLILDIGANHGSWSRKVAEAFPEARFILVEPQQWLLEKCADLIDKGHRFIPAGAGSTNGTMLFTLNNDRNDSSTFTMTEQEAAVSGFKQVPTQVLTIDEIVKQTGGLVPDMIKIDAEGMDLDVLKGATSVLGHTEVILLEASVNATFKDTKILHVLNAMDHYGYQLFDITELNRPFEPRVLWLMELVFVKKNGYLKQKCVEAI